MIVFKIKILMIILLNLLLYIIKSTRNYEKKILTDFNFDMRIKNTYIHINNLNNLKSNNQKCK